MKYGFVRFRIDLRIQIHDQQNIGRPLLHGHARYLHDIWQHGLRERHAILHEYLGGVQVGAEVERNIQ